MRTDVHVAGVEVLAVVVTDVTSSLRFCVTDIRTAIQTGEMGHTQVTKHFLETGSKEIVVHRDGNSERRKCDMTTFKTGQGQCHPTEKMKHHPAVCKKSFRTVLSNLALILSIVLGH